jgi:hypothetical protein
VLALPWKGETIYLAAAYDLVTGAEESGALELRISKFEDDLWIPISILHLTRATLQECVEAPRPGAGAWRLRCNCGGLAQHDGRPGAYDVAIPRG